MHPKIKLELLLWLYTFLFVALFVGTFDENVANQLADYKESLNQKVAEMSHEAQKTMV